MWHADLGFMTATELAGRIRAGELSAREVMETHLAQIVPVQPGRHAIVTLLPERALASQGASEAGTSPCRPGRARGPGGDRR